MPDHVVLRLPELTLDEGLEVEEMLGSDVVTLEREPVQEGAFGDLGLTAAVIVLTAMTLKGFVSYLALRHRGKSFEQTVIVETPEEKRVTTIKWKDSTGEPLEAAVVEALASPGFDVAALLEQAS
jgi:hypothetical protein